MEYYTYMLRCSDESIYTGITTDLWRRFNEHAGCTNGAKYTAAHKPVRYERVWVTENRSLASKLEVKIKQLTRGEKEKLIVDEAVLQLDTSVFRSIEVTFNGELLKADSIENCAVTIICYPKCITCKTAQSFLDQHGIEYELRNIKTDNPTEEELRQWHAKSGFPLKRFFNTSGLKYKELKLPERLADMSEDEQFALLASDGMLVKRPILVCNDFVLTGFKLTEWEKYF